MSDEKSKVTNLRKRDSEFLGFRIKLRRKSNSWVITSNVCDKAIHRISKEMADSVKAIQSSKTAEEILSLIHIFSDSSEQQSMDLMEEMKLFQMNTALVKRNIEYDCLVQRCRLGEQQQLDEIVALIVETISIERENITISGVKYPYQFVKSRLLLLEESHIEYVLDCLHENTREVKNIKAYLLTCLMNSITTIGNYYQAKVNHDMYGGGI